MHRENNNVKHNHRIRRNNCRIDEGQRRLGARRKRERKRKEQGGRRKESGQVHSQSIKPRHTGHTGHTGPSPCITSRHAQVQNVTRWGKPLVSMRWHLTNVLSLITQGDMKTHEETRRDTKKRAITGIPAEKKAAACKLVLLVAEISHLFTFNQFHISTLHNYRVVVAVLCGECNAQLCSYTFFPPSSLLNGSSLRMHELEGKKTTVIDKWKKQRQANTLYFPYTVESFFLFPFLPSLLQDMHHYSIAFRRDAWLHVLCCCYSCCFFLGKSVGGWHDLRNQTHKKRLRDGWKSVQEGCEKYVT